ncbi:hypothetical protein OJAV_G00046880 [Oryzias javanicus]|uniref:Uncharacterized protein n=1 Tax=Oryzias javanicus TaxID=123683 RepID=A0A437DEJ7_ORYJA|nr:hypothetical protein OJAV_G00046880 [Oryzias javanicus]
MNGCSILRVKRGGTPTSITGHPKNSVKGCESSEGEVHRGVHSGSVRRAEAAASMKRPRSKEDKSWCSAKVKVTILRTMWPRRKKKKVLGAKKCVFPGKTSPNDQCE